MNRRFALPFIALGACSLAANAQIKILTSGGFAPVLQELLPLFEKAAGITVATSRGMSQGSGPTTIGAQLRAGAVVDVVILSREGLNDLLAESRIVPGSDRDLAQTLLGVAVRAGAPKPDVSTLAGFKETLLRARSINLPSTTRIYMTEQVLPRLGIAKQVEAKLVEGGGDTVSKGAAEISVQPVSEILHAPGVEFAGAIPREIQHVSLFSAAIVSGSKQQAEARRLIAFFTSSRARAVLADHGMQPPKSR